MLSCSIVSQMLVGVARSALRGAAAGLVATAAMSAWMVPLERTGVMRGQPPRMVVDRFLPGLHEDSADAVALASHAAYGAMAGAVFGLLRIRRSAAPAAGPVFGLALWALGYEGWVPAARVLPPAHRDQNGRVVTMLSAHLVFGTVLGRLAVRRR